MPNDLFQKRTWLARVRRGEDAAEIVGSAFAIDRRHLLTCAHVVSLAGGAGPGARICLDLPFDDARSCRATVLSEGWQPMPEEDAPQSQGDIAVLAIDEEERDLTPLPLTRRRPPHGTGVAAYGFPAGYRESRDASGTWQKPVGLGWTRIERDSPALLEPGFSGSAIWSEALEAAVGMVVSRDKANSDTAFAIPVETLALDNPVVGAALVGPPLHWLDHVPPGLRDLLIDRRPSMEELTAEFVGRRWLLELLDDKLRSPKFSRGYIFVEGEPGIGKSSLVAQLALTRGYPHHFNSLPANQRSPRHFLGNICAQLVARYELDRPALPPSVGDDATILLQLLREAAGRGPRPIVLLVDALDEAEPPPADGVNRLFLPGSLPEGCYVVATNRPERRQVSADRTAAVPIAEDSDENKEDIAAYVEQALARSPDAGARLASQWRTTPAEIVRTLVDKSEGNFMYVRNVVHDLLAPAAEDGRPPSLAESLDRLPQGLIPYYERHWTLMGMEDGARFRDLLAPIIFFMAAASEAVTAEEIADWMNSRDAFPRIDAFKVRDVLDGGWRQFVHSDDQEPPRYRLYHRSFLEFLERRREMQSYREMLARALARQVDWNANPVPPLH